MHTARSSLMHFLAQAASSPHRMLEAETGFKCNFLFDTFSDVESITIRVLTIELIARDLLITQLRAEDFLTVSNAKST